MPILTGFGLKNFRVFKEETFFELAPITVLTGTNSSGKSSLFKAMLLFDDSLRKTKWNYLDFSGKQHKLGNFKMILPHRSRNKEVEYVFEFENIEGEFVRPEVLKYFGKYKVCFSFFMNKSGVGLFKRLQILASDRVVIHIERRYDLEKNIDAVVGIDIWWFWKNEVDFLNRFGLVNPKELDARLKEYFQGKSKNSFFDTRGFNEFDSFFKDNDSLGFIFKNGLWEVVGFSDLFDLGQGLIDKEVVSKVLPSGTSDLEEVLKILNSEIDRFMYYQSFDFEWGYEPPFDERNIENFWSFLEDHLKFILGQAFFENTLDYTCEKFFKISENHHPELLPLKDLKIKDILLPGFYRLVEKVVKPSVKLVYNKLKNPELHYIGVNRASAERYFFHTPLGEFDSFLINLWNNPLYSKKLDFANKWIREFGFGDEMEIKEFSDVAIQLSIIKNGKSHPLTDLGYGVIQLLSIILQVAYFSNLPSMDESIKSRDIERKLFLIEEPETNLHPALQSKLADFFKDAIHTFKALFVIETHSEYLIRKLQYLTAKKEINPQDTSIYYFYEPGKVPEGEPQVKKLDILEDGRLSGTFGPGFFDEADSLAIDLFTLQNLKSN